MSKPTLREAVDGVRRCAAEMAAALAQPMRQLGAAIERFGVVYYSMAESTYLAVHGHLPGSTRTARLRKKRRDIVLRWFNEGLREYAAARARRVAD